MAFEVQDLDQSRLPSGWVFNKATRNLELKHKLADFWEVKGGCLITHHIRPRSKKFVPSDQADLPVPIEHLDNIRVTIFREPGQDPSSTTDHFKTENVFRQHSRVQGSSKEAAIEVDRLHHLSDQGRNPS